MIVAVACDHAGFALKAVVIEAVNEAGHQALDLGVNNQESVDYPDVAIMLGRSIQAGQAERGILLCGSGVGASITANKLSGVYAGVCHDTYSAHQAVENDDMNVLCLGARVIGPELAKELAAAYLSANFWPEERHVRRVQKIRALEQVKS